MPTFASRLRTPIGDLRIAVDERGALRCIELEPRPGADADGIADDARCAHVTAQLREYFAGTRTRFDLPLAPAGTDFQQRAWRALQAIPFGATATYQQQAVRIGRPTATRAVGAANGKNPILIVVPCHRVIGKDGSLVGFGCGIATKQWLLQHERAVIDARREAGQPA